jgi:6-pyruvoyltetrahydropterin/6-carboxytetrahydropterin synthase
MSLCTIHRKATFCSAHRLFSPSLTDSENAALFGKCFKQHGHNYTLDVAVRGPIDSTSGMVMNLTDVKRVMMEHVVDLLDHRCVDDVPWFREGKPSTAENICLWAFLEIDKHLPKGDAKLWSITLHETDNNYVTITRDDLGQQN